VWAWWLYTIGRLLHHADETSPGEILLGLQNFDVDEFTRKRPRNEHHAAVTQPTQCIAASDQSLDSHAIHSRELYEAHGSLG
jgi:hypothetical protein